MLANRVLATARRALVVPAAVSAAARRRAPRAVHCAAPLRAPKLSVNSAQLPAPLAPYSY